MKIKERMATSFQTMDKSSTIMDVAVRLAEKKIGSVFLTDGEEIVGIITETDLVRKVMAKGLNPSELTVEKLMITNICSVDLNCTIPDALDVMDQHRIRHLAVTQHGKITGIVSVRDLIRPVYQDGENW